MDWTLEKLRAKVRRLSGRPDEGQLSNTDLDEYINHYYQNAFPLEAVPQEQIEWYTKNTSSNEDTYAVEEKYLAFQNPFTIAGYPINYHLDAKRFYQKFPETQTYAKDQPTDVLFYNQNLIFRPPPNAVYQFKAGVLVRPDALTLVSDKPPNQLWGPVIAYGSAIEIKQDNGEFEETDSLASIYNYYLTLVTRQNLVNLGTQRSMPRF